MPACANCQQNYDDQWDSCPTCTPKRELLLKTISGRLFVLSLLAIVGAVMVSFSACNAFIMGG